MPCLLIFSPGDPNFGYSIYLASDYEHGKPFPVHKLIRLSKDETEKEKKLLTY